MPESLEQIKEQLRMLPAEQRAELAQFLLHSLDEGEEDEAVVEAVWRAEIARRVADIEARKVVGIPADEVFARLREKYPGQAPGTSVVNLKIETEREDDGRWFAEVPDLPGVMCYGQDREDAVGKVKALALRVLAERFENGEPTPNLDGLFSVAP